MKTLSTELKIGDLFKKDGYTWEITVEPKQCTKKPTEIFVHAKPRSYRSNSPFISYSKIQEICDSIKENPWTEQIWFRKTTMVKVYDK